MDAAAVAVGCAGARMANHMIGRIKATYLAINIDRRELDVCQIESRRNLLSLRLITLRIDAGMEGMWQPICSGASQRLLPPPEPDERRPAMRPNARHSPMFPVPWYR
jgi:hypothetical protein